jgi:nicotinamidase-related amidase
MNSQLKRNDTVLLVTDHQIGLYTGVRDIAQADLKRNIVALVKAMSLLGVPIVMTGTMMDGMWGPIIPELRAALPGVEPVDRTVINAWDEPRIVAAVERTGRRQLLVAGVSLEVCAALPALSAKLAGYDSRVVLDASGTFYEAKRQAAIQRLTVARVPLMDHAGAVVEVLQDNADPLAHEVYGTLDLAFANLVWQLGQSR